MNLKPENHGKPYTIEDDYILFSGALNHQPIEFISQQLQRTPRALCERLHKVVARRAGSKKEKIAYYLQKQVPKSIYDYNKIQSIIKSRAKKKYNEYLR